jgi:hypothetical protein
MQYNLVEGRDYTISYKGNKKPTQDAILTIEGKGNFSGSKEYPFSIEPKHIKDVKISINDVVYTNKKGNYKSKPVLKDENGKKLVAGKDYEKKLIYKNENDEILDSNAKIDVENKVYVVITGKGHYYGEIPVSYKLKPRDITTIKAKVVDKIYTGEKITLSEKDISLKYGKIYLKYEKDFVVLHDSYSQNLNKGTASVKIKGIGNYAGTKTITFKIKRKPLVWADIFSLFGKGQG